MSAIILPDKWRRQPRGPVRVNLAHPLARKISYAIVAGVDLLNPSLSQLTFAENNIYGRVFRGSSPHKVSADTAESTVIGHHYYAGDNNDYAALSWGFYVSAGNNSQLGIGMGPITGSSIYAVNRANGAGSTELEPSITIPYSAIWAITGTLGSGAAAKAYKNGVYFANVAQSGSGTFSQSTSRTFDSYLSSSSGKASAWNYKFNRILPPEEIRELSNAPYQILVKTPRILYFTAPSGGGATITGDSGSYTLTGTAATLKAGRKLAADSGTYNLTGTAAALKVGRKLTADSGTYTLTGTAVAFKRGYALGAESGTYTVSGTSVNLKAGRKLTADSGSYALTGTDVTLNYSPAGSYNLTAESGTYTLTGTAATLKVSRKLTADSGTYALTGTAAGLAKGVRLTAESGSYTLTGSNVAFARTYVLTAESGAYTLTGTSAGLTWSGAPVVEVPTNGGPSIYGKPVFREKQFRKEYEEQVKRIEDEKRLARILREDEEITVIMALMAA